VSHLRTSECYDSVLFEFEIGRTWGDYIGAGGPNPNSPETGMRHVSLLRRGQGLGCRYAIPLSPLSTHRPPPFRDLQLLP